MEALFRNSECNNVTTQQHEIKTMHVMNRMHLLFPFCFSVSIFLYYAKHHISIFPMNLIPVYSIYLRTY